MRTTHLHIVLIAMLAVTGSGCAILAPGEGYSGGSSTLGDAVREASRDSSDKVRVLDSGYSQPPPVVVVEVEPQQLSGSGPPPGHGVVYVEEAPKPEHKRPLFGLWILLGALGGSDYDGFGGFGLTGGDYLAGPWRWDLSASIASVEFKGESKLGRAFHDALDMQLDLTARYYTTPRHTFVGVYGMAGLATGTLFWDYAQRIPVVRDGRPTDVGDDRINHFDGYVGMGTTLVQLRHLQLGTSVVGGVRFYGWHTSNGFDNDVLPTTGFARLQFDVEIR